LDEIVEDPSSTRKEGLMLTVAPIRAYIPAFDVSRARKFYEQSVGLTPKEDYAGAHERTPD